MPCLLLGLRKDAVRLEHVVGGRVPQTQMHGPAAGDVPVIVGVKSHPSGGKPVALGCPFHLQDRSDPDRKRTATKAWASRFAGNRGPNFVPFLGWSSRQEGLRAWASRLFLRRK